MSEVKILKPDKDGILREVRTVKVPDFYSRGYKKTPRKPSYAKRQYLKTKRV